MGWGQLIPIHPAGFAPDMDPTTPGILLDSQNVYPTLKGVRVLPQLVPFGAGLDSTFDGGFVSIYPDGTIAIYAGTVSHLYKLIGSYFTLWDSGQTFAAGTNRWRFTQFLSDTLATDYVDKVQRSANGAAFTVLPGQPPRAKIVASADPGGLGAFAFLFNLVLQDGTVEPDGWCCSAIGNDEIWTFLPDVQSAHARLATERGPITGAHALQTYMIAYKDSAIYTGGYVGGNAVWSFQLKTAQVGAPGNECVEDLGDRHALFGGDNFYTFDGQSPVEIPNAPRDWFFDNADANYFPQMWTRFDKSNGVVFFHFASIAADPVGTIDTWLAWNINNNRWTKGNLIIQGTIADPFPASQPLTYGEFGNLYNTWGGIPAQLLYGDPSFNGNPIARSGVFTADSALQIYAGPPATRSFITTGWVGSDIRLSTVLGLQPHFGKFPSVPFPGPEGQVAALSTDVTNILMQPADADNQFVNPKYDLMGISKAGRFNFRQTARFHRFKITVQSDAEFCGFLLNAEDGGYR